MTDYVVKQGNTTPVIVVGSSSMIDASTDWVCKLRVLDDQGVALYDKTITEYSESGEKFRAYLTPTETGSLAVETYRMVVELSNTTLTPPFNVEQQHILSIEPQMEVGSQTAIIQLVVGTNSFAVYEDLLFQIASTMNLDALKSSDRNTVKAALLTAYQNIGNLTVDFDLYDEITSEPLTSTREFSAADLTLLTGMPLSALIRAQIREAESLIGGNPIEDRRRLGLLSDSVGESTQFFRTSKPLELPVFKATAAELKGYITWSVRIGR